MPAGIHFRFDSVAGQFVGTNVANYVFEKYFQPVEHANSSSFAESDPEPVSNIRALEFGDLDADGSDLILDCQSGNYSPAATPDANKLTAAIDILFARDKNPKRSPWWLARTTDVGPGWTDVVDARLERALRVAEA